MSDRLHLSGYHQIPGRDVTDTGGNSEDSENEHEDFEDEGNLQQRHHAVRERTHGRYRSKVSTSTTKGRKTARKRRVTANLSATKYDVGESPVLFCIRGISKRVIGLIRNATKSGTPQNVICRFQVEAVSWLNW